MSSNNGSGKRLSAFAKRAQQQNQKFKHKSKPSQDNEGLKDVTKTSRQNTFLDQGLTDSVISLTDTFQDQPVLRKAVLPIELTPSQLRPVAYRIITKKHGLNLKSSGLEKLAEFMGRRFGVDWRSAKSERFLDEVARTWKTQDRGLFIDEEQLQVVIREVIDIEEGGSRHNSSDSRSRTLEGSNQTTLTGMLIGDDQPNIPILDEELATRSAANRQEIDWRNYYKVVNAHSQPPYRFNPSRKQFELAPNAAGPSILAPASSRTNLFASRYHIALAGIHRQDTFQAPTFLGRLIGTGKRETNAQSITMIKNMLGREGMGFILFGLVSKGANGNYWLQDSSGSIELDLELHAIPAQGSYYIPGSLCICDGIYSRDKFIVTTVGTPTCELRRVSRSAYGYLDFLGLYSPENTKKTASGPTRVDRVLDKKLINQERTQLQHHRFFILGCNIFLDKLATLDALRKLFARLQADIQLDSVSPICIVFPGSFVSSPFQPNGSSSLYKDALDALAAILEEFPVLLSTSESNVTLLFVPGDNDPWASTFSSGASPAWPLKSIPQLFTNRLRRVAPGAEFATNPTRIAYMSQEILVVRDDLGARLRRNQIIFPELERRKAGIEEEEVHILNEDEEDELMMELALQAENPECKVESDDDRDDLEKITYDTTVDKQFARLAERNKKVQELLKNDTNARRPEQEQLHVDPDVAEARKIVKTILDQGNLSPFPLSVRPVSWDYDYTLNMSPVPTVLIMIDPTSPPFKVTYQGCHVVNPGLFMHDRQVHWVEYTPSTRSFSQKSMYI